MGNNKRLFVFISLFLAPCFTYANEEKLNDGTISNFVQFLSEKPNSHILFLVDGSSSVSGHDWADLRYFLADFISLDLSHRIRVSLVVYSSQVDVIFQNQSIWGERSRLFKKISELNQTGGFTNTGKAFLKAHEIILEDLERSVKSEDKIVTDLSRSGELLEENLIVLITESLPNDHPLKDAKNIKNNLGVKVISFGYGAVTREFLEEISSPKSFVKVEKFAEILQEWKMATNDIPRVDLSSNSKYIIAILGTLLCACAVNFIMSLAKKPEKISRQKKNSENEKEEVEKLDKINHGEKIRDEIKKEVEGDEKIEVKQEKDENFDGENKGLKEEKVDGNGVERAQDIVAEKYEENAENEELNKGKNAEKLDEKKQENNGNFGENQQARGENLDENEEERAESFSEIQKESERNVTEIQQTNLGASNKDEGQNLGDIKKEGGESFGEIKEESEQNFGENEPEKVEFLVEIKSESTENNEVEIEKVDVAKNEKIVGDASGNRGEKGENSLEIDGVKDENRDENLISVGSESGEEKAIEIGENNENREEVIEEKRVENLGRINTENEKKEEKFDAENVPEFGVNKEEKKEDSITEKNDDKETNNNNNNNNNNNPTFIQNIGINVIENYLEEDRQENPNQGETMKKTDVKIENFGSGSEAVFNADEYVICEQKQDAHITTKIENATFENSTNTPENREKTEQISPPNMNINSHKDGDVNNNTNIGENPSEKRENLSEGENVNYELDLTTPPTNFTE